MSLRLNRSAKALRARYGVAEGVRQAPAGYACTVEIPESAVTDDYGAVSLTTGKAFCADAAKVKVGTKGICEDHWEEQTKPQRN